VNLPHSKPVTPTLICAELSPQEIPGWAAAAFIFHLNKVSVKPAAAHSLQVQAGQHQNCRPGPR
jgi:hypothetical protein